MSTISVMHGQAENWNLVPSQGIFTQHKVQVCGGRAAIVNMLRPGAAREFSLTMPTKFSYHTYYHSYSMSTNWMSCGKPAAREEREFVDMLSPVMPFPESGRSISA